MSEEAMRAEKYTYIEAWGKHLGSQPYYIKAAQEKAAEDHAPADALYKRDDGTWFCRSDLEGRNHPLRVKLDRLAGKKGGG